MKVLHVVRSDGFGGVERHIANLARAQVQAGHHVMVVGGDPTHMAAVWSGLGIGHAAAVTTLETWARVEQLGPGADIVHAHMTAAEVACCAASRAWRKPIVSTRHFAEGRGRSSVSASRWASAILDRRLSAQIAVSAYAARRMQGAMTVVHAGVPSHEAPTSPRRQVVLVVQRLEKEKDTDTAIRAFAASGLAGAGWTLHIAGDGSQRASLEALTTALSISRVTSFLGQVPDVEGLLAESGMLIAPSSRDSYGLSVLEAMAWGLPVIATGAAGHLETVGTVPGARLFAPGDHEEAGRLLASLAEDEDARRSYGSALLAAQRERFTMQAQEQATDAVYRSVL